ncbi:hypothetical protein BDQ17DRAFT_1401673 [Cyathus striatus]|nr:hypothetical protein BDQ17DRAFT_1401673 [Cyathus striatus]
MSELRILPGKSTSKNTLHNSPIPNPSHRHAAPSAPWPWMDIDDTVDDTQLDTKSPPIPKHCDHSECAGKCWKEYPKSCFPNWTEKQVKRSNIWDAIKNYDTKKVCIIYHVDVNEEGRFANAAALKTINSDPDDTWKKFMEQRFPKGLRVRALFIENLSGPVLQILGAKYNIEPFFFSSSLNWIPSRYQEDVKSGVGDHITISVTFLRTLVVKRGSENGISSVSDAHTAIEMGDLDQDALIEQMIDTKAPLDIKTGDVNCQLILDFLSVHLVRRKEGSIIISYHPNYEGVTTTTAKDLHKRIRFAGQSVYWQNIFQRSPDPPLENLYIHICRLESKVITEQKMFLTQQLHTIRAHLLHYASLLEDIRKTVEFIRITQNPALDDNEISHEIRNFSKTSMERECSNLLSEISRLEKQRTMQAKRLKNVMGLVFNSVNILDSRHMQEMTEAAVRDSAEMKQIAYLTMIFLPASYVAAVFGMNVKEIVPGSKGSIPHYLCIAIPMTILTIWVIMAFQSLHIIKKDATFWERVGWPILLYKLRFPNKKEAKNRDVEQEECDSRPLSLNGTSLRQDMDRVRQM